MSSVVSAEVEVKRSRIRIIDLPLHLGRDGFTPSTRKCQIMDGVKPSLPSNAKQWTA